MGVTIVVAVVEVVTVTTRQLQLQLLTHPIMVMATPIHLLHTAPTIQCTPLLDTPKDTNPTAGTVPHPHAPEAGIAQNEETDTHHIAGVRQERPLLIIRVGEIDQDLVQGKGITHTYDLKALSLIFIVH